MEQDQTTVETESNALTTMAEEIARLRAENADLHRAKANAKSSIKVSGKGAVSVYGIGRFPVTLYQEQWTRLLALSPDILAFIAENKALLKAKAVKATATATATE